MSSQETSITINTLSHFEPLATMSSSRLQELAGLCFIERISKEMNPLRLNMAQSSQLMFLLAGDLGLRFQDGSKKILRAGTPAAKHSIDERRLQLKDAIALTEIQIIRIDLDLLDIMMTWDQLSRIKPLPKQDKSAQQDKASQQTQHIVTAPVAQTAPASPVERSGAIVQLIDDLNDDEDDPDNPHTISQWMRNTDMFSAQKLKSGIFSRLPPANIQEMFRRMQYVTFPAGQVVVQQGAEGDYYYLIESGEAVITRVTVSQKTPEIVKTLTTGDFFGEEAVVSEGKSNITATMQTDGAVLRLKKSDFNELLKAPLVHQVSNTQAQQQMNAGRAILVDVRFPSEFRFDAIIKGAVNLPLNQLRQLMTELDKTKQYITYCQTGRRSSAAAFILIEQGFDAVVLSNIT